MRDATKGRTYDAEQFAFEDTLLAEAPGFNTLVIETNSLVSSRWWQDRGLPAVFTEQIRSTTLDGVAQYLTGRVAYRHGATRSTVPHELAHIVVGRTLYDAHQAHGPEWRGFYVQVTGVLYGHQYGERLHKTFTDGGLTVTLPTDYKRSTPLVDIDKLGGVVCGGWRR